MSKENWILIAVIAALVIGTILMIKFLPLWATFISLASFIVGGIAGWVLKAKDIIKKSKQLLND